MAYKGRAYGEDNEINNQTQIADTVNMIRENLSNYSTAFSNPALVKDFVTCFFAGKEREHFLVMFLDTRHRLIKDEVMFSGTIDGASVYPREVAKRSLELNAAAVILAHNHPSGDPDPSHADEVVTKKIVDGLDLLDIRVLDHMVAGAGTCVSFAERGLI